MIEKLPGYKDQLTALDERLSTSEVMSNMKLYKELMMERSHLAPIVEKLEEMKEITEQIEDSFVYEPSKLVLVLRG